MTWTHPGYEGIARVLRQRTGLSFSPVRTSSAEFGIRRAMTRAGVREPEAYLELLSSDAGVMEDLIVELTVGETYFFREPGHFEFIRNTVLPDLRSRAGAGAELRAWSAGCASGEEAYSLAILFEEEGFQEHVHLLATDISRPALGKARRACYTSWSLRGDGAIRAQPYLQPQGNLLVLEDRIRRRVTFEYLNLALDVYPSFATGTWGMNLILCRNVLIYFDRETIQGVARRFYEALAPGGYLLTASVDPPLWADSPLETVATDSGVFYRRSPGPCVYPVSLAPPPAKAEADRPKDEDRSEAQKLLTSSGDEGLDRPLPSLPSAAPSPSVSRNEVSPASVAGADPNVLALAREVFAHGDYARAAALTRDRLGDLEASVLHVRALANLDPAGAERACAEAAARHTLCIELQYLHTVLLLGLHREDEAIRAIRRVLYLDRRLAIAHFTLGSILEQRGNLAGAQRAYRNARDLAAARPADEVVPFSDGEPAGRLAEAAAAQLATLMPTES